MEVLEGWLTLGARHCFFGGFTPRPILLPTPPYPLQTLQDFGRQISTYLSNLARVLLVTWYSHPKGMYLVLSLPWSMSRPLNVYISSGVTFVRELRLSWRSSTSLIGDLDIVPILTGARLYGRVLQACSVHICLSLIGGFYFLPLFTWYLYDLPSITFQYIFCPSLLGTSTICPFWIILFYFEDLAKNLGLIYPHLHDLVISLSLLSHGVAANVRPSLRPSVAAKFRTVVDPLRISWGWETGGAARSKH
jgi:hypothetical protein